MADDDLQIECTPIAPEPADGATGRSAKAPLCDRLVAARGSAGLEREEVCRITRISPRNLAAMEEGRWGDAPAPVYLRGYLRSLAALYKIDPQHWLLALEDDLPDGFDPQLPPVGGGLLKRPVFGQDAPVPLQVGHVMALLLAILSFFLIYFALEGNGADDGATASSHRGSLIEMLDTRPIQKR